MTEITNHEIQGKLKMPWWQKVYRVAFGLMVLTALYGLVAQFAVLFGHSAMWHMQSAWMMITGFINCFAPLLLYSFLFFVCARNWSRNEEL